MNTSTTSTDATICAQQLQADKDAAFNPFQWQPGDEIPDRLQVFLPPNSPVDREALVLARLDFCAQWVIRMRVDNAMGFYRLTFGSEVTPDGSLQGRHLTMSYDSVGYSLRVSEASQFGIATFSNDNSADVEETLFSVEFHPLTWLLTALCRNPELFTFEPLDDIERGAAWELRLGDPEELSETIAEIVQHEL